MIPVAVFLCVGANECRDMRLTLPRWRGQCWEPEPSQNRWRQPNIATIWLGWSLRRSERSAGFAVFSHETLKVKKKIITKQHTGPLRLQFSVLKNYFSASLSITFRPTISPSLNLWMELFWICLHLNLYVQSYATTVYLPIIKLTNSSLSSQPSVLNPLPAISGHVSFL